MIDARDESTAAGGRIYIVEDDPAVRDSLSLLLELRGYTPIAYDSAEALLAAGAPMQPACALIDVRLPGMDGLALQQRLKQIDAALPVVVISGHGDVATARTALRAGAVDFIEKPIDEHDLLEAVASALRSANELARQARNYDDILSRMQRLTDRELEVFERVTDGKHNREIAEEFGISQRTVEVHRARLMDKLQARRVADLFRMRFELDRHRTTAQ
jgi:RNA polymerase sigma factor (sigma-70 family)